MMISLYRFVSGFNVNSEIRLHLHQLLTTIYFSLAMAGFETYESESATTE